MLHGGIKGYVVSFSKMFPDVYQFIVLILNVTLFYHTIEMKLLYN